MIFFLTNVKKHKVHRNKPWTGTYGKPEKKTNIEENGQNLQYIRDLL